MTGNHPIWSIDRKGWIDASALVVGEQVKTQDGFVRLQSKAKREGIHTVYNLEVYRDHNFLVSTDGILVHNECAGKGRLRIEPLKRGKEYSRTEVTAAWHMASKGKNVILRPPKGKRSPDGQTSDLVVNGVNWDVYTPRTGNVGRIASAVASKNNQARGGILILETQP